MTYRDQPESTTFSAPVKLLMAFIDRVGFPIVAFLLIFYLCYKTMKDNTEILSQVKETLIVLNQNLNSKADRSHDEHTSILEQIKRSR